MHALSVYETDAVLKTIKTASLPYRIMCCCSMLASGWTLRPSCAAWQTRRPCEFLELHLHFVHVHGDAVEADAQFRSA